MSQAVHLITKSVPGYGPTEGSCIPHSRTSAKSVVVFPLSSCSNTITYSQVKIEYLKCASGSAPFICRANSGGPNRNTDYSKQNRQNFSRNRSRHTDSKDNFENLDESNLLTSKNGPLLTLSNTPKFQATAASGPREKEIIELFRKVQAQLREKSAVKQEKKVEATKGKGKESETVDSLLKLLKKHSIEQGKEKVSNNNSSSGGFGLDQPESNGTETEYKNTERSDIAQLNSTHISRPPSNFQRKSPIPKVKFDSEKKKQTEVVLDSDEQPQLMKETKIELKHEPSSYPNCNGGVFGELLEPHAEIEDLSLLKLAELRALAKSRGVKGYSKMKKGDLVELLSSK